MVACVLGCIMCLAGRGEARGDATDRLAHLAELRGEVSAARGPFAYLALRKVWSEWDQGDPSEVEETLRDVAADAARLRPSALTRRCSRPTRAVDAAIWTAHARRSRTSGTSATG